VDVDVRFTQTEDAFYILVLPVGDGVVALGDARRLVLGAPVPILEGDRILKIGEEEVVEAGWDFDGETLSVDVDIKSAEDLRSCWVLRVDYCA
jgi:hypothetical protein